MSYTAADRGSSFTTQKVEKIQPMIARILAEEKVTFHVPHKECKGDPQKQQEVRAEIGRRLGRIPKVEFKRPNLKPGESAIELSFSSFHSDKLHSSTMEVREVH